MYYVQKLLKNSTLHVLGAVFCATTIGFAYISSSSALTQSWDEGAPTVKKVGDSSEYNGPDCQWIKGKTIVNHATSTRDLCVYEGKNIRFARGNASEGDNYISIGSDQYFYRFSTSGNRALLIRGTNTLVVRTYLNYMPVGVMVYHDLAKKIEFDQLSGTYDLNMNSANLVLKDDDNGQMGVESVSFSENGEWMTGFSARRGIIRLNLYTGDKKLIVPASSFPSNAVMYQDISDDGQYIATVSTRNHDRVYHVDDSCGTESMTTSMPEQDTCSYITIPSLPESNMENWSFYPAYIEFQNDDQQLNAVYWSNITQKYTNYKISQPGYTETPLDYLALGDSYSSGEGDDEIGSDGKRRQHYFQGTEKKGECHISDRSYPFLFTTWVGIEKSKMRSVACSGAQALPDIFGNLQNYSGQGGRLARSGGDLSAKKMNALNTFKPGIVPQLEFVKKYQPKVLTITMGGNDIGFGQIIQYCASPEMIADIVPVAYTCGYAVSGDLRDMLYASIDTQAVYTARILKEIMKVGPDTKIFLVGYPKFVNDTNLSAQCFNSPSLSLDITERQEINNAIEYMNRSLESEAAKAGVHFVDIEDSLQGGRLCEGSEYVTGLMDVGYLNAADQQESFHPNSFGHEKIADEVLSVYRSPSVPKIQLNSSSGASTAMVYGFSAETIISGIKHLFSVSDGMFQPSSAVEITAYSTPTKLLAAVAGQDGSLYADVDLSQLSIGRHIVTLTGKSFSGEPLTLYQFVTVAYSQTDADGDGIPNDRDACQFITSMIDEKTGLDICQTSLASSDTVSAPQVSARAKSSQGKSVKPSHQEIYVAPSRADTVRVSAIKTLGVMGYKATHDVTLTIIAIFVLSAAAGGIIYVIIKKI